VWFASPVILISCESDVTIFNGWLEHTTGSASSHVEDTTVAVASNTFGAIAGPIKPGEA
jgi:hypothetical protein